MPSLANRYPDLLTTLDDPALSRLVADLDAAYAPANAAAAPPPELRQGIGEALARQARIRPVAGPRRRITRPLRAGLGVLMAAAVLGGAAVIGLAGRDDTTHSGFHFGNLALPTLTSRGEAYHLMRQVCGFTLSLDRAYADANSVIVSYSIAGPADRTFVDLNSDTWIATAQNGRLHEIMGVDISSMEHNRSSIAVAFDTHAVARHGGRLDLRLVISAFTLRQKKTAADWRFQRCEQTAMFLAANKSNNSGLSLLDRLRRTAGRLLPRLFAGDQIGATMDVSVNRPLTIPFSVPIDPAHIEVHPNQATRAGSTTLILDRVIATRSEMRVYLRRATPGHILENAQLELSVDGQHFLSYDALFGDWWTRMAPASRRYDFAIPGVPYRSGATYTLTVRPRAGVTSPGMPWRTLSGGPWVFHFRL